MAHGFVSTLYELSKQKVDGIILVQGNLQYFPCGELCFTDFTSTLVTFTVPILF